MSATVGTAKRGGRFERDTEGSAAQQQVANVGRRAEEVRVAMALNGGVSLAVWMGGCAVELDAARRAHLGPEDLRIERPGGQPAVPPPGSGRTIYNALCTAFDRELVIDLMSGSSAGGINGALLAAAIDGRRRLHPDFIRDKWLKLGDFESLLHPLRTPSPTSLMGGHAFFLSLRRTFEEILPTGESESNLTAPEQSDWQVAQRRLDLPASQLDREDELDRTVKLDITATDVLGEEQRFRDTWGEELVATEYRQRFRFRKRGDYNAQRLAMAARASASFPLAFEPWAVHGEMLGSEGQRWLIDGGLLDNAPIRAVLDLIPSRRAERPVQRFLCYLNADPPLQPTFDPDAELEDANNPASDRDTKASNGDETRPARPQLQDVVAYMVNLPRKAAFVDQLKDIQHAACRSTTVDSGERPLLTLDENTHAATAGALLPAYRSRRRLATLEEMLLQPSDVAIAADRMANLKSDLPWIPSSLAMPDVGGDDTTPRWGWGARAAARALYVLLDVMRPQITADGGLPAEPHVPLMAARKEIYTALEALEDVHEKLVNDATVDRLMRRLTDDDEASVRSTLSALGSLMLDPDYDPRICAIVERAARRAFDVRLDLGEIDGVPIARALFGAGSEAPETVFGRAPLEAFLQRTLHMEVIRRAFTAEEVVDSDQPLLFAQLTPCAPTLIFAPRPLHPRSEVPSRPDQKLTGTRWGHFAAFYRASWRANDFMWGRLDGAVRVVDMLLPPHDGTPLSEAEAQAAGTVLADALLPPDAFGEGDDAGSERRHLVAEALTDALPVLPEERRREQEARDKRHEQLATASRDSLVADLAGCIADDLRGGVDDHPPRVVTRALCIRAAQWEILRRELPIVIAASKKDRALGTSVPALDAIPAKNTSWWDGINALRAQSDTPLPERLGVDDQSEKGSALMIRTASHGAMVGLSALRETGLPGSPAFLVPRALLLPIAGMVARRWWPYPFAVAFAFWSFALVVAFRLITVDPNDATAWDASRWLSVLVTWLAAAGVVMVCLVPFWRLVRGASWNNRLGEGAWLLALASAGGAVGAGLHLFTEDTQVVNLVAQTGSEPLWAPAAGLALVVVGAFRFVPQFVPGPARRLAASVLRSTWKGPLSLFIFLTPWLLLGGWAMLEHVASTAWGSGTQPESRDQWTARIACVGPPLVACAYVTFSVRRRGGTLLDSVRAHRR